MFCLLALPASAEPRIHNLGEDFRQYWAQAPYLKEDQREELWKTRIEGPNQSVYDRLVWDTKVDRWEQRRKALIDQGTRRFRILATKMQPLFERFPATLAAQTARFRQVFPDANFDIDIYAMPGLNFDGKAGVVDNHLVLAFGIDRIVEENSNPDVLYSHELFHIYHNQRMIRHLRTRTFSSLMLALWAEGFAVYVSAQLNPTAKRYDIFMDPYLAAVAPKEMPWIATRFLTDMNRDGDPRDLHATWFALFAPHSLRKDLPSRCGYLLGYEVVRLLAQTYSVGEMTDWSADEINEHVRGALQTLIKP